MSAVRKPVNQSEPSKAQMVAALIAGTAESEFTSAARQVMVRIPEHFLAQIDAMAGMAKKSRNAIVVELVDTALESVLDALPDGVRSEVDKQAIIQYASLQDDNSDRVQMKG